MVKKKSNISERLAGKHANKAFVLSLFDTGLGVIRSLGRLGIPVVGLDSDPDMCGFKSKYCTALLCPSPVDNPDELADFMIRQGKKLDKPGIVFPASDAFVLFLSRYRDELKEYFHFAIPSCEVLEGIINKRKQYEMAESVGIPYPKTFYPESMDDVHSIENDLDYPAFIKPYCGHLWREKYGGTHKGFKVNDKKELELRYSEIFTRDLDAMVQSIILGPNTNHFKVSAYMNDDNEPLALFTLRKIRQYPTEFGVGTAVESLYYPELAKLGMKFFKGINYRGIGSIEFKKDERDGKLKLIELNPRLWQQNNHATDCGMNFPLIQYQDLTGHPPSPVTDFKEGVRWMNEMGDFQSFWSYNRQGKLSFFDWLASLKGIRSFGSFAWDDLGPFLKNIDYGYKYLRLPLYLLRKRSGEYK